MIGAIGEIRERVQLCALRPGATACLILLVRRGELSRGESEACARKCHAVVFDVWRGCSLDGISRVGLGRAVEARRLHRRGDAIDVARQAGGLEEADGVAGEVELPPAQAVEGRAREGVVVVVPALAEGRAGRRPTRCGCGRGVSKARLPKVWQTELTLQVTWWVRNMRTRPPQSRPVSAPPSRRGDRRGRTGSQQRQHDPEQEGRADEDDDSGRAADA